MPQFSISYSGHLHPILDPKPLEIEPLFLRVLALGSNESDPNMSALLDILFLPAPLAGVATRATWARHPAGGGTLTEEGQQANLVFP